MANKVTTGEKGGLIERFAGLSSKLHAGAGALAVGAVLLFPEVAIASTVAVIALGSAALHEVVRQELKDHRKSKQAKQ